MNRLYYIAMSPLNYFPKKKGDRRLVPAMYGGSPRFHKTRRGAAAHVGRGGKVLAIDLCNLPAVAEEENAQFVTMTDFEFAERQMLKWSEIAESLRSTP